MAPINKKPQQEEVVPPANTDAILGHLLQSHHNKATEANKLSENHITATARNGKLLENSVEASGRMLKKTGELVDETKKTNEGIDKIAKLLEPEKEGDEIVYKIKAKKGEKGDTPTDEALIALIKPLIPEPEKGEQGESPTEEELLALIRPLIPEAKNGDTPTDEKLLSLIARVLPTIELPQPLSKEDVEGIVKPLIPKIPEPTKAPTAEELVDILKGKIPYEFIKDTPNLDTFRRPQASKSYALSELTDVILGQLVAGQVLSWNGVAWIPTVDSMEYVDATGTADAIIATFPAITAFSDGLMIGIGAAYLNTSATPTLNVSGLGAKTITKGANLPLVAGDIGGPNHEMIFVYNAGTQNWVLINPTYIANTARTNTSNTFTGAQIPSTTALASSGGSITIDLSLNNNFSHAMTENTTLANPTNAVVGQTGTIYLTQHASVAKTLAFGANWVEGTYGSVPVISTTLGAVNTMDYEVVSSSLVRYYFNKAGIV